MLRCLFPIIVQYQWPTNYRNRETDKLTGAYVNGKKVRQGGGKARNLKRSLMLYHKSREMAGDVPLARGARDVDTWAREVFNILERVMQQQSR